MAETATTRRSETMLKKQIRYLAKQERMLCGISEIAKRGALNFNSHPLVYGINLKINRIATNVTQQIISYLKMRCKRFLSN